MPKFAEPFVSTVVHNPTSSDIKYRWIGKNGLIVTAGSSVTLPYEVFTAAPPQLRGTLDQDVEEKTVIIKYLVRGIQTEQTRHTAVKPEVVSVKVITPAVQPVPTVKPVAKPAAKPAAKEAPTATVVSPVKPAVREDVHDVSKPYERKSSVDSSKPVDLNNVMGWSKKEDSPAEVQSAPKTINMEEALGWPKKEEPKAETVKAEPARTEEPVAGPKKEVRLEEAMGWDMPVSKDAVEEQAAPAGEEKLSKRQRRRKEKSQAAPENVTGKQKTPEQQ